MPLGRFTPEYDHATGTERLLSSLDLVGVATVGLIALLTLCILRGLRTQPAR